jgi:hypothetical protein
MGVYTANHNLLWPHGRIYCEWDTPWAEKCITEFNRAVGKTLFMSRSMQQPNYVRFQKGGGNCQIGMQGGVQMLKYSEGDLYSIYHEMGHCAGLGHEWFHPQWPHRDALLGICGCQTVAQMRMCNHLNFGDRRGISKLHYLMVQEENRYRFTASFDRNSIMSYNPANIGLQGIPYARPQKPSPGDAMLLNRLYPGALPF